MTKEEFVAQLDRAALALARLPVSAAMLQFLSAELKKGEPSWWQKTAKVWQGRSFVSWSQAWPLFLTCVHNEALGDAESPLAPYFPSCGGTDEADPSGALAKFLADPSDNFFENLKKGERRAYVASRAPLWIAPAAIFFQTRDLPFYVVEVNAGAGLNLAADLTAKAAPGGSFSELVAARVGLDVKPLLLEDIAQRRWLTAGVLPDNVDGIRSLDAAADAFLDASRRSPNLVQLAECPADLAPRFLAKNIPAEADVGLLVLNMGVTAHMNDADYERYGTGLAQALAPWGDRALWLEVENVRGESFSTTYQARLGLVRDGGMQRSVLATLELNEARINYVKEAEAFLLAGLPPIKKKPFLPWSKIIKG